MSERYAVVFADHHTDCDGDTYIEFRKNAVGPVFDNREDAAAYANGEYGAHVVAVMEAGEMSEFYRASVSSYPDAKRVLVPVGVFPKDTYDRVYRATKDGAIEASKEAFRKQEQLKRQQAKDRLALEYRNLYGREIPTYEHP